MRKERRDGNVLLQGRLMLDPDKSVPTSIAEQYFVGNHEDLVSSIASFLQPDLYVEVGTDEGHTLRKVLPHCVRAIGMDLKPAPFQDDKFMFWQGDSLSLIPNLDTESVQLAFIDSAHDFNHLKQELILIHSKITPTGIVLLHDTCPAHDQLVAKNMSGDVYRIRPYLANHPCWSATHLHGQFGISVLQRNTPEAHGVSLPFSANDR